jgi:S-adenosylmethionine decarboxylase
VRQKKGTPLTIKTTSLDPQPANSASSTYLVRHIVVEVHQSAFEKLDDLPLAEKLLQDIAQLMNTDIMKSVSHHFHPQGITAVLIVGASHLSIHTWPEHGYACVDMVVCTDNFNLQDIITHIQQAFQAKNVSFIEFRRGLVG